MNSNKSETQASPTCPQAGGWRAWVDGEDTSPQLAQHLAGCPECRRSLADLRGRAAQVHAALSLLAPEQSGLPSDSDIAVARERLAWQRRRGAARSSPETTTAIETTTTPTRRPERSQEPLPMFLTRISTPWRIAAGGVAAAFMLSLLVSVTPGGRALASGFLAQFRSQQVTALEVTPQTQAEIVKTMNALGHLGTVKTPGGTPGRPQSALRDAAAQATTVTLAEASQRVGFTLATPDPLKLPAGLDKTPRIELMPASQVRFTVDKAKADAYFKANGHASVTVPDKFDGAALVVSIPAAALLQYGSSGARDALIVGEAGELVVDVEGKVSLDEMRDFLLGLPDMPPSVVGQLRQMSSWSKTIPIPVPVDQVSWQNAAFHGNSGLLLNDNSGVGSAAIWYQPGQGQAPGHMYGLAGSLKADDLKVIADTLQVR